MSAPPSDLSPQPASTTAPSRTSGSTPPAWRDEVSARLRDHRSRRTRVPANQPPLPGMENAVSPAAVAARVAERYSRLPSWRDALAVQTAAAAPSTIDSLLVEASAQEPAAAAVTPPAVDTVPEAPPENDAAPPAPWQPDLLRYSVSSDSLPTLRTAPAQARAEAGPDPARRNSPSIVDPLEDALVEPAAPLPARILAFPRELVAPHKARPHLAEGPLRADSLAHPASGSAVESADHPDDAADALPGVPMLRILEAEPEAAVPPHVPSPPDLPQWHSIHLDAEASMHEPRHSIATPPLLGLSLHVASFEDRIMAGVVDFSLTLAAFLLFVIVFAACTTHPPAGRLALLGAGLTLLAMWELYQFLFFSVTDSTPGMRYAKIALCTFDNENPTRSALRGRIAAQLLSALPLGLGFLWAIFDQDALGWHDRITQTYQRSYREP